MENGFTDFETVLKKDGRLIYTNVGVSMLPLIREGRDIITVERPRGDLKKYDVVLFKREHITGRGRYVLHRIIKILPDNTYFIAGDNCSEGELVPADKILGVLTGVMKNGGKNALKGAKYRLYVIFWCAPYRTRFIFLKIKRRVKYLAGAALYKLKIKR